MTPVDFETDALLAERMRTFCRVSDCPPCGYGLQGAREGRCPECGFEFTHETVAILFSESKPASQSLVPASIIVCVLSAALVVAGSLKSSDLMEISGAFIFIASGFTCVYGVFAWLHRNTYFVFDRHGVLTGERGQTARLHSWRNVQRISTQKNVIRINIPLPVGDLSIPQSRLPLGIDTESFARYLTNEWLGHKFEPD